MFCLPLFLAPVVGWEPFGPPTIVGEILNGKMVRHFIVGQKLKILGLGIFGILHARSETILRLPLDEKLI